MITGNFDLSSPGTWDATRAAMNEAIDLAAVIGGCAYFTPGRRDGRSFDELDRITRRGGRPVRGVRTVAGSASGHRAIAAHRRVVRAHACATASTSPNAPGSTRCRPRQLLDGARLRGQRPPSRSPHRGRAVRRCGLRLAGQPPPGGRAVPGDGDLPISRFFEAALDAGYTGPSSWKRWAP